MGDTEVEDVGLSAAVRAVVDSLAVRLRDDNSFDDEVASRVVAALEKDAVVSADDLEGALYGATGGSDA